MAKFIRPSECLSVKKYLKRSMSMKPFCGIFLLSTIMVFGSRGQSSTNGIDHLRAWQSKPTTSKIISWNAYSRQFIDPPVFKLLAIPGATVYSARVWQAGHSWHVESAKPMLDLAAIWRKIDVKGFELEICWLDNDRKVIASEKSYRVKAPDWDGLKEPNADWRTAADRGIAYLIDVAKNGKAPYRQSGVPVWIWSCASPTVTKEFEGWIGTYPNGYPMGYPCITLGNYIWAFLACAHRDGPQKDEALRLARVCGDWGLTNHLPDSGALPGFPYSTITMGKFSGGNEGETVNLLRPSWLGVSYVDLYRETSNRAYLDYAEHIADVTMKFQKEDGSFPYRINPKTGVVVEDYTCAPIEFVELVEALKTFDFDVKRAIAAQRALDWTVGYVCDTMNWKGIFEDVFPWPEYSNLSGFETQMVIRYLCRHRNEDPRYLPLARRLNRWLEDQFVVFGPESEAYVNPIKGLLRVKGPLVFEQYQCWLPMEGHTGFWIQTLIELHKATGDKIYLDKARAAANAICALQYQNGSFSTLGMRYYEDGKIVSDPETGMNWYNSCAAAITGLYALDNYIGSPASTAAR
jgi:hypothetical protein